MNTRQWMLTIVVPMALLGAALSFGSTILGPSGFLVAWVGASLIALPAGATTCVAILRFKAFGQEPTGPVILAAFLMALLMAIITGASVAALSFVFLVGT